jgi:DNA polymerase-3 subunit delta'
MPFGNIKGHDNIVLFFKRALGQGAVSHSYLFFGPEGVGKALMAEMLAKALNCLTMTDDSCDKCASCVKIDNKNHPDIARIEVEGKKDAVSIEQVRELERQINLKAYEARTKVFIITEADKMSEAAANCLLKTLEEPPKNSVIILVTSRAEDILPTVKSRCKQVKFEPLELSARLGLAMDKGFLKEEAVFLSKLGDSDVSLPPELEAGGLFEYKNSVLREFNSGKALLEEGSFIFNESKEGMRFIISILASWFRDMLVLKSGGGPGVVINADRIEALQGLKNKFSFEELEFLLKEVQDTRFCIDRNIGPKLAFNDLKMKLTGKADIYK